MNWPNRITILRVFLVPAFIMAVMYQRLGVALAIFALAAVSDALDGYLARVLDQRTRFGSYIDPIADKLLINSAFVCFSLVQDLPGYIRMPVYVPLVIISRDVLILLGFVVTYLMNGKVEVRPSMIGKVTTSLQMATVMLLLVRFVWSSWAWNITVLFTIVSGLLYLKDWARGINGKT
jgi:cardiolipin synthase